MPASVGVRGVTVRDLVVGPGSTCEQRKAVLQRWYRDQMKAMIPLLLEGWQPKLGLQTSAWGVKKMKAKWGSCYTSAHRIWSNLELVQKPVLCLEQIVVHELAHLLECAHNERFTALTGQLYAPMGYSRAMLNAAPLEYEVWEYRRKPEVIEPLM